MKQRAVKIPVEGKPRLAEALERLVQLYDAWGKPDQATRWRRELESEKANAKPRDQESPTRESVRLVFRAGPGRTMTGDGRTRDGSTRVGE
jgi:hypothetical protein